MNYTFIEEIELGSKSAQMKLNVLRYFILNGESTLPDLGKEMDVSVPTVTKIVWELMDDGFVVDFGKVETNGGRRPNNYGINPNSGYFLGVDIKRFRINLAIINFKGEIIESNSNIDFLYENTPESFSKLCDIINQFVDKQSIPKNKILSAGINISGRVNAKSGHSYSHFYFSEEPLSEVFHKKLGMHVTIDNDSRSMAYGEYMQGVGAGKKDVFFINVSWGLGMGLIVEGKLFYGKSGFSGEFGHINAFDNEVICHCGKKGCLETEASGSSIIRRLLEKIAEGTNSVLDQTLQNKGKITLEDLIEATNNDDMLAIELVEEVGNNLGKHIASLINIFNPEAVIIGGSLSLTGDYLLLPIRSAVKRYSLNLMSKDTEILLSELGDEAGIIGACLLARSKMLGIV